MIFIFRFSNSYPLLIFTIVAVSSRISTAKGDLNHLLASFHQSLFIPNALLAPDPLSPDSQNAPPFPNSTRDPIVMWIVRLAFSSSDDNFLIHSHPPAGTGVVSTAIDGTTFTHPILPISSQSITHLSVASYASNSTLNPSSVQQSHADPNQDPNRNNLNHEIVRRHPHVSIVAVCLLHPSYSVDHPHRFIALRGKNAMDLSRSELFPLDMLVSTSLEPARWS